VGIALSAVNALIDLHKRFGAFGTTVQIGRQGIYVAEHERSRADEAIRSHGLAESFGAIIGSSHFADEHLLPAFGATSIFSADASPYEGATIIHDFNNPLPSQHHMQFDTLLEFGSLEHIFNVPVALANMMNMVKIGGRLLSIAPANNWLGHGFYQIGPELPFRVFHADNGFEIISVRLVGADGSNIELSDRGAYGVRNEIGTTSGSTDLITIARKISDTKPFSRWPQQGDYAHEWERKSAP